MSSWS